MESRADIPVLPLEHVPALTWTADETGRIDWMSAEFARQVGRGGDAGGTGFWPRIVHPADLQAAQSAWDRSVASGEPFRAALRLRVPGGLHRWHLCTARCHSDDGRRRWVGIHLDIDQAHREVELKQASLERVELERTRLRSMVADLPVAVVLYSGPAHRIELMNRVAVARLGGRSFEGRTFAEAFPEALGQGVESMLDHVFATGETVQRREFPVRFDRLGSGRLELGYFDVSWQALRDPGGAVSGVLSCSVEVSGQVQARNEIARLAAERAAVLEQLNEGVITADADGRISFVNQHAHELHGVTRLDVAPEQYTDAYALLREDGSPYPAGQLPLTRAVLHDEVITDARWCIRRPDGSVIAVEGAARPVYDATGTKIGAVLTMHEIRDTMRPGDGAREPVVPAAGRTMPGSAAVQRPPNA
jgi:PAS domain S-box-containing protein